MGRVFLCIFSVQQEYGPDHEKNFDIAVCLNDKILGCGSGPKKKVAEQAAARSALDYLAQCTSREAILERLAHCPSSTIGL
jgi:ribonuclease-3